MNKPFKITSSKVSDNRRFLSLCLFRQLVLSLSLWIFPFISYATQFIDIGSPVINDASFGNVPLDSVDFSLQDREGFIWLANNNEIFRFDGSDLKPMPGFKELPKPLVVTGIVEGTADRIWIATKNSGLLRYEKNSARLRVYGIDNDASFKLMDASVNALFYRDGTLYVANNNKILTLDESSLELIDNINLADGKIIHRLFVDSSNAIWAGVLNDGVHRIVSSTITHLLHDPINTRSIGAGEVNRIIEDSSKRIWLALSSGLDLFQPADSTFIHYTPYDSKVEPYIIYGSFANSVGDIVEGNNGHIWLDMQAFGLIKFEPETEAMVDFRPAKGINSTLPTKLNLGLLFDKQKTLWIFNAKGVSRIHQNTMAVQQWANIDENDCSVRRLVELRPHFYFTCGNELFQLRSNHSMLKLASFNHLILDLVREGENSLWLTTLGGSVFRYSINSGISVHYPVEGSLEFSPVHSIFKLLLDTNGTIYGLAYNSQSSKAGIVQFEQKSDQFSITSVNITPSDFMDVDNNRMVIFSANENQSVHWFNKKTKHIEKWELAAGNIFASTLWQNNIWISSENKGLLIFSIEKNRLIDLTNANTPIFTSFHISQNDNQLYATSKHHIYRIEFKSENVIDYHCLSCAIDLANTNWYSQKNTSLNADRQLFFGSKNKLISIDLNNAYTDQSVGKMVFTDFKVMEQSVSPLSHQNQVLLVGDIGHASKVTLMPETNSFSINFARINYIKSESVQYAYKMEGLDKDWIQTDVHHRERTYAALPAGNYVFKAKSTDTLGRWLYEEPPISIEIQILPPWRLTWWAFSFYVLAFIGIVSALLTSFYRRQVAEKAKFSALELAQTKERLFANLSHEFRTPLTLILGPAEMIKQHPSTLANEEVCKNIELIERNGKRLLSMVDQLLDVARLQGKPNNRPIPHHVAKICQFVIQSFQPTVKKSTIRLFQNSNIDDLWWVSCAKGSLETILFNLISNAIKYTGVNGEISMDVTDEPEWIKFSIVDNGCGIAQKDLKRIFERFTRLEQTHGDTHGVGIGLALVKELLDSEGATISVSSQLGQGSCFTFCLPRVVHAKALEQYSVNTPQELPFDQMLSDLILENFAIESKTDSSSIINNQTEADNIANPEDQQHSKSRILIVEDNSELRNFIAQTLSDKFIIDQASNGKEGLILANDEVPDLIISDVMMPQMDGFQFLNAIRETETTSHIPLILLTAKGDQQSKLKGLSEFADDYITKPFDPIELQGKIANLIGIRTLLRQRFARLLEQSEIEESCDSVETHKFKDSPEHRFILRFDHILNRRYIEPELKVADIAENLHMTERQLFRKLKAILDITPAHYLRNHRLKEAANLISEQQAISEVAYNTGFSSPTNFSRSFKAMYGCTPSEYAEKSALID